MDAKVIILLVFILFGMIVAYMVANGMVDLTSIFSRVTKSQAQESLGGVKLEIVSPVAGVYYQATEVQDTTSGNPKYYYIALGGTSTDTGILKITGKNLNGKTLTISVASPHWYLDKDDDIENSNTISENNLKKTLQFTLSSNDDYYDLMDETGQNPISNLYLVRDTDTEPFNLPEFVELIFAVGETAKAEVTIVVEP